MRPLHKWAPASVTDAAGAQSLPLLLLNPQLGSRNESGGIGSTIQVSLPEPVSGIGTKACFPGLGSALQRRVEPLGSRCGED